MKYLPVVLLTTFLVAALAFPVMSLCPINSDLSLCQFPENLSAAEPAVIRITTTGDCHDVDMAFVEVRLVLDTGSLDPEQQLTASGTTDQAGEVELFFPDGIRGDGSIHFEVLANGIELCTSASYTIASQPVPALPTTWGQIKTRYEN